MLAVALPPAPVVALAIALIYKYAQHQALAEAQALAALPQAAAQKHALHCVDSGPEISHCCHASSAPSSPPLGVGKQPLPLSHP